MKLRKLYSGLALLLTLCSCATSFTGSAKVDGGPRQCSAVCKNWGMDLSGMVSMGEYANGCICTVKGANVSSSAIGSSTLSSIAGSAGAVGVIQQMAAQQQQQHR